MELKERTTYHVKVTRADRTAIEDTISALKDLVHQMTDTHCSLLVQKTESGERVITQLLIEDSIDTLEFLLGKDLTGTPVLDE